MSILFCCCQLKLKIKMREKYLHDYSFPLGTISFVAFSEERLWLPFYFCGMKIQICVACF